MRERTVMRGMARLFWRYFNTLAVPSTLWESGHFYFAPTTVRLLVDAATSVWYEDMVHSTENPGRKQKERQNEVPDRACNTLGFNSDLPGDHSGWGGRRH